MLPIACLILLMGPDVTHHAGNSSGSLRRLLRVGSGLRSAPPQQSARAGILDPSAYGQYRTSVSSAWHDGYLRGTRNRLADRCHQLLMDGNTAMAAKHADTIHDIALIKDHSGQDHVTQFQATVEVFRD